MRAGAICILLCLLLTTARATHNRAGEITYKRIAPTTSVIAGVTVEVYVYLITIVKYTDYGPPQIADRCADTVYFGDGERGIAFRINGNTFGCNNNCPPSVPCGSIIVSESGYVVNKNTYTITHTYPGPGQYLIRNFDPNRNQGVVNIPASINQPFYVESLLIINGFTGANTSPALNNEPVDKGCVGQCFQHDPGAFDVDGDSLSYELTTSRGLGGFTVPGYTYPDPGAGGTFSINPITGRITWCNPQAQGEYNIAFIVREWRKNTNRVYQQIGYVLRDMQIIIKICAGTIGPPVVTTPPDTCVEAGAFIEKRITVSSPNDGHLIVLTGAGGGFSANNPKATLSNTAVRVFTATGGQFSATYRWQTTCDHIRQQPYFNTFKAQDNDADPKQTAFNTYVVRVVPPSVKNVTATPFGSTMKITWSLSSCNPTSNPIVAYKIYRKEDCTPYVQPPCATSIAASSGYKQIGQTDSKTAIFFDNNNGSGLVVGQSYGYLVVALYADGTQTYGNTQVCAALKRDIPVLLNVDILNTSATEGRVRINWSGPLITPDNLDTTAFPPPYKYILKQITATGGSVPLFTTTASGNALQSLAALATTYTQSNVNTVAGPLQYLLEFISGTTTVGFSQKAASVFLSAQPSDRRVDLSWSAAVPWNNYKYTILRKDPGATAFSTLAIVSGNTYADTNKVVNKKTYCYYVISEGAYSDPQIIKPLINNSQEACVTALDLTPPCTPTVSVETDCPSGYVKINWSDVKKQCPRSDDVLRYDVFFKSTVNGEYTLHATYSHTAVTEEIAIGKEYVSGCYAVQAIDSAGNRSPFGKDFCIDNCPLFELPNVFTPNKDGVNDFFKAIKVRQIAEIDLKIFDRWGNLVYETKDPYFKWNGNSLVSGQEVSEGTFFYVCDVYEPRLRGIIKRVLRGNVSVIR